MPNPAIVFPLAMGSSFWEQIAGWYQNSTLGELVSYFRETYFSIRFGLYARLHTELDVHSFHPIQHIQ